MKTEVKFDGAARVDAPQATMAKHADADSTVRWEAVRRMRLPHRVGVPLSSSGVSGDGCIGTVFRAEQR
jgi:hypothetical protein